VLVERMVTGAVAELILGLRRDPQFGNALVVGAGGILTELLKDTATLLLPATETEIRDALAGLKSWPLVTGFRGRQGDAEAVVRAVQALALRLRTSRAREKRHSALIRRPGRWKSRHASWPRRKPHYSGTSKAPTRVRV
jgi:acetyl-CoA synthetase